MASSWFVDPDSVRLDLPDGQWLLVKKELNAGDTRAIFSDLVKSMPAGERAQLDPSKVGLTKIVRYVLEWSLQDKAGKPVPFSEAALLGLKPERYQAISDAIDAHDESIAKELEARKQSTALAIA